MRMAHFYPVQAIAEGDALAVWVDREPDLYLISRHWQAIVSLLYEDDPEPLKQFEDCPGLISTKPIPEGGFATSEFRLETDPVIIRELADAWVLAL